MSLKENQKTLYNDVKLYIDDICKDADVINSSSYYKTVEKGHGSITDKQFKCLLDSLYLDRIVNNWICS